MIEFELHRSALDHSKPLRGMVPRGFRGHSESGSMKGFPRFD
jgi:hypothetical protein